MELDSGKHRGLEPSKASTAVSIEDPQGTEKSEIGKGMDDLHAGLANLGREPPQAVGPAAGFFNLLKSCIGAGILGIPLAFSLAGWGYGLLLLALIGLCSGYGLFLLSACAHRIGGTRTSWGLMTRSTYVWLAPVVDLLVIVNDTGAAIAYLIVIGQNLAYLSVKTFQADNDSLWANPNFWRSVVFFLVITPLSCLPRLSFLKFSSVVGVVCVFYVAVFTVLYAVAPSMDPCPNVVAVPNCGGEVVAFTDSLVSLATAIPIINYAFGASENIFLVYNELADPSVSRMANRITNPVTLTAGLTFAVTALSVYLIFGDTVKANFLLNYPPNDVAVDVAYLAVVIFVTAATPLELHPARASVITLTNFSLSSITGQNTLRWWGGRFPTALFVGATVLLLGVVYALGLLISELGLVYALVGAIASPGLMFWVPGFAFHKLFAEDERRAAELAKLPDAEKAKAAQGAGQGEALFSPFWVGFHRDAALTLGIFGVGLSVIALSGIGLLGTT